MEKDTESDIDENKIDDAALALLYLTMHNDTFGTRAWKNIDWDVMDRLYEKGYISDPKSKAKSVVVTSEGEKRSEELFNKLFGSNK
jgi:hypothetical protein